MSASDPPAVTNGTGVSRAARQRGVVRWAARYDLLIWVLTLGRERGFRERLLRPARLQAGESVLDVGCGTGALAMIAKQHVGRGAVHGIDASPEMIARARHKARRARVDVVFQVASADALPYPDDHFDVALSTVMLHHLPRATRVASVREMGRVLKPSGRALLVDFAGARRGGKGPRLHFHRRGHVDPRMLMELAGEAGLRVVDTGPVGRWRLHYVLAAKS